jgi:uncharacterized protein
MNLTEYLLTAFILGVVGSLHCVGMCGAIVLSLPIGNQTRKSFLMSRIQYNFGRVITYSLLGFLVGSIGSVMNFSSIQRWLSITVGAMLITWVAFNLFARQLKLNSATNMLSSAIISLVSKLTKQMGAMLKKDDATHPIGWSLIIGVFNGLLPCGLVYAGLSTALLRSNPWDSALTMMVFGLGTVPSLMIFAFSSEKILSFVRSMNTKRLIPTLVGVIGVVFILRGLELGIPYISPSVPTSVEQLSDIKNEQHCSGK